MDMVVRPYSFSKDMPETIYIEQQDGRIFPRLKDNTDNQNNDNCLLCLSDTNAEHQLIVSGIYRPRYLDFLFKKISINRSVYFVQVGAMDGVSFDPINEAVKKYAWHGLLVEPLPDLFSKLKNNYTGCQGLKFENSAVTDDGHSSKLFRIDPDAVLRGDVPSWALGISSLYSDRNALGGRDISAEVFSVIRENTIEQEVEGVKFCDLINKYQINNIDILQLDTEGHDFKILKQVDLARFRPDIIQMEFCNLLEHEKFECLNFLKKYDYTIYISINKMDILAIQHQIIS